jgi:uncharacterized Zn finger protein/superfamily II DNA or RNA helicase
MAIKYGKTWWGQKWLDTLNDMDRSGRLARGRALAGNGSVLDIQFNKNKISAKVQGSMPKPYKVSFELNLFSPAACDTIVEAVNDNVILLADLLNKTLPPALLDLAEEHKIKVFPTKWSELNMNCSCPDYSVPCKHLAAVVFSIANKIDIDPFFVFELRGLDLITRLSAGKSANNKIETNTIEPILDWLTVDKAKKKAVEPVDINAVLLNLDFSKIPTTGDRMLQLLQANPPFTSVDFKKTMLEGQKKVIKPAKKLADVAAPMTGPSELEKQLMAATDAHIEIDKDSEHPDFVWMAGEKEMRLPFKFMADWLLQIDGESLNRSHPKVRLLHATAGLARKINLAGLSVPRIWQEKKHPFALWMHKANVPAITEQLAVLEAAFDGLVFRKDQKDFVASANAMQYVLAMLMTNDIARSVGNNLPDNLPQGGEQIIRKRTWDGGYGGNSSSYIEVKVKIEPEWSIALSHFFFGGNRNVVVPEPIYQSANAWLSILHIGKAAFTPVLQVEEAANDHFLMKLHVRTNDQNAKNVLPIPFAKFFAQKGDVQQQMSVIKTIALLQSYFPDIAKLANVKKANESLQYAISSFGSVLTQTLPVLEMLGIELLLPRALRHLIKPAATVRAKLKKQNDGQGFMSLSKLIEFDWQIALGDDIITEDEFMKMLKSGAGLIKFRENYIHLTPEEMDKIRKQLEADPNKNIKHPLHIVLAEEYNGSRIEIDAALKQQIEALTTIQSVPVPPSIKAQLRPYQQRGYEWLYKNASTGLGSILADDMGLGKTLQTITLLQKMKDEGQFKNYQCLVVCPTTLITNWCKEIERFAPDLSVFVYHGSNRNIKSYKKEDIFITTYGLIRSDADKFKNSQYRIVVIDEAQNIKNISTEQTIAVKKLKAEAYVALSGTPVENRLSEYWSIFDFSNQGWLGNANYFNENYARPIQLERHQGQLAAFKKITAPFIMRRLKSDKSIINDLPDKVETNVFPTLTPEQVSLYEATVQESLKAIEDGKEDGIQRQGLVLKMMTSLKQICNHPSQYTKTKLKQATFDQSGKMVWLQELLEPIIDNGEKTLIFTQYTEMGEMLSRFLHERFGFEPLFLHGGLTRTKRDELVDQFNNQPHQRIFILSIKAGGTGLNLTKAQHVVHYDLWWNPAVEAQATDRAYRIGQKKNVMVYRFISKGTLEEKIDDMIQAKKNLADMTVTAGEKWIGDLSNAELKSLVSLSK